MPADTSTALRAAAFAPTAHLPFTRSGHPHASGHVHCNATTGYMQLMPCEAAHLAALHQVAVGLDGATVCEHVILELCHRAHSAHHRRRVVQGRLQAQGCVMQRA